MISKESHPGTLDNICGAIAKMIIVNPNGIPLEQVSFLILVRSYFTIIRYSVMVCLHFFAHLSNSKNKRQVTKKNK